MNSNDAGDCYRKIYDPLALEPPCLDTRVFNRSETEQRLRGVVSRGLSPYLSSLVHSEELQLIRTTGMLLRQLGLVMAVPGGDSIRGRLVVRKTYLCEEVFGISIRLLSIELSPKIRAIEIMEWPSILNGSRGLSLRGKNLLEWLKSGLPPPILDNPPYP